MLFADWEFENLVVSNKCKTIKLLNAASGEFENLVVSNKYKNWLQK